MNIVARNEEYYLLSINNDTEKYIKFNKKIFKPKHIKKHKYILKSKPKMKEI